MNLTRLAGNGPLKRQLELETARRGLSHAYILSGPAGSGKRTLAGLLAAALVCTGGVERPCLSCPGCGCCIRRRRWPLRCRIPKVLVGPYPKHPPYPWGAPTGRCECRKVVAV